MVSEVAGYGTTVRGLSQRHCRPWPRSGEGSQAEPGAKRSSASMITEKPDWPLHAHSSTDTYPGRPRPSCASNWHPENRWEISGEPASAVASHTRRRACPGRHVRWLKSSLATVWETVRFGWMAGLQRLSYAVHLGWSGPRTRCWSASSARSRPPPRPGPRPRRASGRGCCGW